MYQRIVSDSAILGGKPIVKGTRISVEFLLELFASGATREGELGGRREVMKVIFRVSPWR